MSQAVIDEASVAERAMHWITALLIGFQLLAGFLVLKGTSTDYPAKAGLLMAHMIAGMLAGVAIIVWLAARLVRRRRSAKNQGLSLPAMKPIPMLLVGASIMAVGTGFAVSVLSGLNLAVFAGQPGAVKSDWSSLGVLSLHWGLAIIVGGALTVHLYQRWRIRLGRVRSKI